MKKQWSTILAIILLILVVLFAMANMEEVPVQFGFTSFAWPLILVILGSLLAGALIATLISTSALFTSRRDKREAENRLHELENSQNEKLEEERRTYEKKAEQLRDEKSLLQQRVKELEREVNNLRASHYETDEEAFNKNIR